MKRWAILTALCIASMGVQAQVYRCGNTYTQEPCKGGREVDVTPPVSDLSGPKTTVIYLCRAQGAPSTGFPCGVPRAAGHWSAVPLSPSMSAGKTR